MRGVHTRCGSTKKYLGPLWSTFDDWFQGWNVPTQPWGSERLNRMLYAGIVRGSHGHSNDPRILHDFRWVKSDTAFSRHWPEGAIIPAQKKSYAVSWLVTNKVMFFFTDSVSNNGVRLFSFSKSSNDNWPLKNDCHKQLLHTCEYQLVFFLIR